MVFIAIHNIACSSQVYVTGIIFGTQCGYAVDHPNAAGIVQIFYTEIFANHQKLFRRNCGNCSYKQRIFRLGFNLYVSVDCSQSRKIALFIG